MINILKSSFEVVDIDFYWFMKRGKIPTSYLNNSGEITPKWVIDKAFVGWYDDLFYRFMNIEKIQLKLMVDEL